MPTDQDWAPAVQKLVALTESGKLTWERCYHAPPRAHEIVGDMLRANVQGRYITVYEYRFKSYEDEDTWSWETEVAVEFVDSQGELQWRWPATSYRWALIDAIRAQLAGAPDFLRKFLAEGKPA
ncbi:MAG TPA: hypothetical protein VMY37_33110 [Thermoguttaceae bacterium]|nr:hypothetical protein [Thermoguttaceae bacterium]